MNDEYGDVNIYINLFGAEAYDSCNIPAYAVALGDEYEAGLINFEIIDHCGSD